ncbi:MAG: multiheme c-type cytochrome [Myxococcota bacterium]|nr:multiheme c-type cytochrome [Myxococcota bacterium]
MFQIERDGGSMESSWRECKEEAAGFPQVLAQLRRVPQTSFFMLISLLCACASLEEAKFPSVDREGERHTMSPEGGFAAPSTNCASCHPRQAEAFAGATMAYGLLSPAYNAMEASLMTLSEGALSAEGELGAFCSDCHALNAAQGGLERVDGTLNRDQVIDPVTGAMSCESCHRAQRHGAAVAEPPKLHPSAAKLGPSTEPMTTGGHAYRGSAEDREWLRSPAFCAQCHDVRPRRPDVSTGEPFGRIENLFTEWSESPWAQADHPLNPLRGQPGIIGLHEGREGEGEQITCQDCHMSLYPYRDFADRVSYDRDFAPVDPSTLQRKADKLYPIGYGARPGEGPIRRVSGHSFPGASQPLTPFPLPTAAPEAWWETPPAEFYLGRWAAAPPGPTSWAEWRAREAALRDRWGHPLRSFARRRDLLRAAATLSLDALPQNAPRDAPLQLDLWVENVGAGHRFPAGFSQERELWVALTVHDEGRACTTHQDCEDLIEARYLVDERRNRCEVSLSDGRLDPTLRLRGSSGEGNGSFVSWGRRLREERSGLCDEAHGRCILYRSGYLIDLDGDGRVNDEPLRHQLIEESYETLERRCVLSGPDVDQRPTGRDLGLVWFHNELQRVEVDETGAPVELPGAAGLRPSTPPPSLSDYEGPLHMQAPAERRHKAYTDWARYERLRYLPARSPENVAIGGQARDLIAPHLFKTNRYFNGNALRPFEPRLARYTLSLPEGAVGPLRVRAALRLRFFSPRTLRVLAARHPELLHEAQIDAALEIVDVAEGEKSITLSAPPE